MTEHQAQEELKRIPILLANGGMSPLWAYKVDSDGLYFSEAKLEKSPIVDTELSIVASDQVNFTSQYTLLNSAGRTYRVQHIDKLIQENVSHSLFGG